MTSGIRGRIVDVVNRTGGCGFRGRKCRAATGFFADLTDLSPNPGAEAYEPNLRFWSDYGNKSRWFLVKNTTDTLTYSRDGIWTVPSGMIWAKHFDLELDRGNPATSKRIETRLLVKRLRRVVQME